MPQLPRIHDSHVFISNPLLQKLDFRNLNMKTLKKVFVFLNLRNAIILGLLALRWICP